MRSCDGCSVCCFICRVPELHKASHVPCKHQCADGCAIHEDPERPARCATYSCLWLEGHGLPEDRPDLNGVYCFTAAMNGGHWVYVIEAKPDAVMTAGRGMVERLATLASQPVVIVDYGVLPPEDKGNRVVVKPELLSRATQLKGALLTYLDEEGLLGVYELVVH